MNLVALILEVNPNFSWFDVQDILISSAHRIMPNDNTWVINSAGFVADLLVYVYSQTIDQLSGIATSSVLD
jgi:hypothetical protein